MNGFLSVSFNTIELRNVAIYRLKSLIEFDAQPRQDNVSGPVIMLLFGTSIADLTGFKIRRKKLFRKNELERQGQMNGHASSTSWGCLSYNYFRAARVIFSLWSWVSLSEVLIGEIYFSVCVTPSYISR